MGHGVTRRTQIATCLMALVCLAACSAHTAPAEVRHADPATVGHYYSLGYLLTHVGTAINGLAGGGEYTASLLASADSTELNLPPAMAHVWSRYRALVNELSDTVDALEDEAALAEEALDVNRVEQARLTLERSTGLLNTAEDRMARLEAATADIIQLARRFGRTGDTPAITRAAASLDVALQRLNEHLRSISDRIEMAKEETTGKQGLVQPVVSCHLSTHSAWLGDPIVASGRLTDGPFPLPGRTVCILFNDGEAVAGVTDSNGYYRVSFPVPFEYAPRASVAAAFLPEGDDSGLYLAATSSPHHLTMRYHHSDVELAPVGEMYPGISADVAGTVRSLGAINSRRVTVFIDDEAVGGAFTNADGFFLCAAHVPDELADGSHTLTVHVEEDATGLAAPAESTQEVRATRVAPHISLRLPSVVFHPLLTLYPGGLLRALDADEGAVVDARVTSPLPLTTSVVEGTWNGRALSAAATREVAAVHPSDTPLFLSGWQEIRLETARMEPWHTSTVAHGRFFVVNLLLALPAILLCMLVIAWALARHANSRRSIVRPYGGGSLQPSLPQSALTTTSPGSGRLAPRNAVVGWYWAAISTAAESLNRALSPAMTMRETSTFIADMVPPLTRLLEALTSLAQESLYSGRSVPRRYAAAARWLKVYISGSLTGPSQKQPGGEA